VEGKKKKEGAFLPSFSFWHRTGNVPEHQELATATTRTLISREEGGGGGGGGRGVEN
jgi:hypothetical protein